MTQAAAPAPDRTLAAAGWREALREGRTRLKQEYLRDGKALSLLSQHSQLVDTVLKDIWQQMIPDGRLALVAVGGYGRGELYPYSDVDLLILLDQPPEAPLRHDLEQLVGLLWDIGLEVGHSVRTIDECLAEAARDTTVQTNLLEARRIIGHAEIVQELGERLRAGLDVRAFFEAKLLEQQQRHQRYNESAYNLEPNLKESPGGLRDLQTVLWFTQAANLGNNWPGLVRAGIITYNEARQIERYEQFLRNMRIRLHYLAGRREDRILFDYQKELAAQMGFVQGTRRLASEELMRRYYRTAKSISQMNEIFLKALRERINPAPHAVPVPINERFQIRRNLLEARDLKIFREDPSSILESFVLLQEHSELQGMSPETLRALWRAKDEINPAFRQDPHNRKLFMRILGANRKVTHVLRMMNQYGILGKYLPNFGRIVGQMQHDLFHIYTVDEHILFVVRNLRRFAIPDLAHEYPLCSRLMNEFSPIEVLYAAGLFHDIAKGRGGDHSALGRNDARRFCEAHGFSEENTELVVWLVGNHLLMSAVAQKQDLTDPDVIRAFAEKVKTERYLIALYLLTVADIRGTSPKVWNAWKAKLLEDLFFATRRFLRGDTATPAMQLQGKQVEALRVLSEQLVPEHAHENLWRQLDDSYFLRHSAQEIAWHTRLLNRFVNTQQPIVKARLARGSEGIQVMIYMPDQNDLFARICATFERIRFTIVEAKIYTTRHGYALNSFYVLATENPSGSYRDLLSYIEYELTSCLGGGVCPAAPAQGRVSRHLKHFPIEPEVTIQPDEKGLYHILSLIAGDRPGLLSRIAQVFVRHGVHLHTAKIMTLGDRAEDTFLIRTDGDEFQHPQFVVQLERDLLAQLQMPQA